MKNLFLAVLLLPIGASAGEFDRSARGSTTAQFLRLGAGARATAMGEAYSAVADEASALYWNPAAMVQVEKRSVTLMHAEYLGGVTYDYGAFAQNLGRGGAWGFGFQHLTAGKITETDQAGVETGSFRPTDLAAALGYAYELDESADSLEGVSFGVAAKFVRTKVALAGQTAAADLGVLSPRMADGRLRLAGTVQNIGGRIKLDREGNELPLSVKLGAALKLGERWLAALDVAAPRDNAPHGAAGTEYRLPVGPELSLAGRLGFNSRTIGDVDGVTGLSAGFGLIHKRSSFDYSFVPFGSVGQAHRISLTLGF